MKYLVLIISIFVFSLEARKNYVLLGPPGSGKGTLASCMAKDSGYKPICPGDILRAHIRNNTDIGKSIKPLIEAGEFVNDVLVFYLLTEEIKKCVETNSLFVLDFFPQNKSSFELLKKFLAEQHLEESVCFVHFIIDDQRCMERIKNRLVCFNCFDIYNTQTKKPRVENRCDTCSHVLERRIEDEESTIQKRLQHYRTHLEPLIPLIEENFPVTFYDPTYRFDPRVYLI